MRQIQAVTPSLLYCRQCTTCYFLTVVHLILSAFFPKHPANEWHLQMNCALRTKFLTAITADASLIFIGRRIFFITVMPVDSLGGYGTHVNTNSAFYTLIGHNIGLWHKGVFDCIQTASRLENLYRFSVDIKVWNNKLLDR